MALTCDLAASQRLTFHLILVMPVYSYTCETCGDFDALRTVAERNRSIACPSCASLSQRIIVAPHLSLMAPSLRRAHSTNERSQHAPRISSGHTCSSGCEHATGTAIRKNRLVETRLCKAQSQKAGARPWMLGH